jgi:N4-gp56 family major capsid protein
MTTSSGPTNSIRTLYASDYREAYEVQRLYEIFSHPVAKDGVERAARLGNTLRVNFLADIPPGTSAIPESTDVTPTTISDAYAEISPTSRYVSTQWSEHLDMDVYTNWTAEKYRKVGMAMAETIDLLARDAMLQGNMVLRAAARGSLDAGTTSHHWTGDALENASIMLQTLKVVPFMGNGRPQYFALAHPAIYKDLRLSDNIVSVAQYQRDEIIMAHELAQVGPFKIISSPLAKVFIGQGSAHGTALSTTTAAAITALDKTFTIATTTSLNAGEFWVNIIDTAETANTHVATNERVKWVSDTDSVVTIVGEGANGGFRFGHSSGVAVTNADNVYTVAYGGPQSLAKMYDPVTGEFGKLVERVDGMLEQFLSLSAKFYGGYGRWNEAWVLRGEYSCSMEA